MPRDPETQDEVKLLGKALRSLREQADLSQKAAGQRMHPPLSDQGWSSYEIGRLKGILEPTVQLKLLAAIGASPEAFRFEVERIRKFGPPPTAPHTAARGMSDIGLPFRPAPGMSSAQYHVSAGIVVLTFPDAMDAESIDQLEEQLAMFIRVARARVSN